MRAHVFGGSMIVAGTAIGAGMLALPVVTAEGGFVPSIVVYLACFLFMLVTGLLIAELCLKNPEDTNLLSLAGRYTGKIGRGVTWALYLFLFYSLQVAYVSAGGTFVSQLFHISPQLGMVLFTAILGLIVVMGTLYVDRCNLFFITGLGITYLLFLIFGYQHLDLSRLSHISWSKSFLALPVIFTAFSYQGTVPSLVTYLGRDRKKVKRAIVFGTLLVFIIYFIFQGFILGLIPLEGPHGLIAAKEEGFTAIAPLGNQMNIRVIFYLGQFFSFFAIATSFLGVTLGLFDFFADGLKIAKRGKKKILLALCTFTLPLLISMSNPSLFLVALSYAGGVGCALLLGFLPTLFVWISRYRMKEKGDKIVSLGKAFLSALFLFVLLELSIEAMSEYLRLTR
jgi:tyrosine-specific transport protein